MNPNQNKITCQVLQNMKRSGKKISALTSYDYAMASILDAAGVDIILVGDSVANVFSGHSTTLPVTLDQMIYHASAVVRACQNAMVVVDLPFGSYQGSPDLALQSAVRVIKETGADAVKLEGGEAILPGLKYIIDSGIPVMGHLGLTPQSILSLGSFSLQAKKEEEKIKLLEELELLEAVGVFSVVLEKIPASLARKASRKIGIPTIGIGAGAGTDGQILVINDLLGMTKCFAPKFLRKYLNMNELISNAVNDYIKDVKNLNYPNEKESY